MSLNPTVKTILGILLSVFLTIIFIFEVSTAFRILHDKMLSNTDALTNLSKQHGSATVSIDNPAVYPAIEDIAPTGDVIAISNSTLKVRINGVLTDDARKDYGVYKYADSENSQSKTFNVNFYSNDKAVLDDAYNEYFYGDPYALFAALGLTYQPTALTLYQQDYRDAVIPVIYNAASSMYFAFVPTDDSFLVMSCVDPFVLSTDKVTVHYGDPHNNPMLEHTYSDYEVLAAENQLRKLAEKALHGEDKDIDNPYTSSGTVGTSETYTSRADNNLRAQMVSYADYKWSRTGIADGTSMYIDTTSEKAKESEWKLTSTTYAYSYAGLSLMTLSGERSNTSLKIGGNIANTLTSERPYVIVVKYVNDARELLGLQVLDCREQPLKGNGYMAFMSTVYSSDVPIEEVTAVQFEIY